MSSKKFLVIAVVFLLALGAWSATSKADVTGSFGVLVSLAPIPCYQVPVIDEWGFLVPLFDQPCEETVFKMDLQTDLNINIAISGLTIGLHSHAGVTGIEDVILSFAATLGALDIRNTFVFAQPFVFGVTPVIVTPGPPGTRVWPDDYQWLYTCIEPYPGAGKCETLFVKKHVEASISLGGVTFRNLAMFEDVNFPQTLGRGIWWLTVPGSGCNPAVSWDYWGFCLKLEDATYSQDDQAFGFGDVISIEGQTPSGITISGETGICAEPLFNYLKKHAWPYQVNRDCAAGTVLSDISLIMGIFNQGPHLAHADQIDTAQSGSLTIVQPMTPSTLTVANTTVTITEEDRSCGAGTAAVVCSKHILITASATNPGPAVINFTVSGFIDPPATGWSEITCDKGFLVSTPQSETFIIDPGEFVSCRWTGSLNVGTDYETRVSLNADPDVAEAVIDIIEERIPKPPLFFDYEKLRIEGIPIAAGLTGDIEIICGQFLTWPAVGWELEKVPFPCLFDLGLTITGGPIFPVITFDTFIEKILGPTMLSGAQVMAAGGPLTFIGQFGGLGCTIDTLCGFAVIANFTINPDTNPASLRLRFFHNFALQFPAWFQPAPGIPDGYLSMADIRLDVTRAGLTFFAELDLDYSIGPPATFKFDDLTVGMTAQTGVATLSFEAFYDETWQIPEASQLIGAEFEVTVSF
jgi:hypothetical protein